MGSHPAPCHGCLLLTACASYGLAPYARSRVPLPAACAGYGIAPYAWSRAQALPAARAGHKLAPRALFACPARCALTPHLSTATILAHLQSAAVAIKRSHARSSYALCFGFLKPRRLAARLPQPRSPPRASWLTDGSQLVALARRAAAIREAVARCDAPKLRAPPHCSVCHFTPSRPQQLGVQPQAATSPQRQLPRHNLAAASAYLPQIRSLRLTCRRSLGSRHRHSLACRRPAALAASRICPRSDVVGGIGWVRCVAAVHYGAGFSTTAC